MKWLLPDRAWEWICLGGQDAIPCKLTAESACRPQSNTGDASAADKEPLDPAHAGAGTGEGKQSTQPMNTLLLQCKLQSSRSFSNETHTAR